jgi:hypothetical protein
MRLRMRRMHESRASYYNGLYQRARIAREREAQREGGREGGRRRADRQTDRPVTSSLLHSPMGTCTPSGYSMHWSAPLIKLVFFFLLATEFRRGDAGKPVRQDMQVR